MLRLGDYIRDLRPAEWGFGVSLRGSNPDPLMSALGQKQTYSDVWPMSALPPKADIAEHDEDVRFVPKADMRRPTQIPRWRGRTGAAEL